MGTWLAVFDHEGDVVASISKRPDHKPIEQILDEYGDEIFKDADSIAIEIDTDKEIVKKTFTYAEKYGKEVYALVSNMTIAVERRTSCAEQHVLSATSRKPGSFSEDYEHMTAAELAKVLPERVRSAQIARMVVTMGGDGAFSMWIKTEVPGSIRQEKWMLSTRQAQEMHFFSGVCIGLTYGKSLQDSCRIGTRLCSDRDLYFGEYLPEIYAGRIWSCAVG